ncbi:hypothetical protein NDR87_26315 [Nocardia sp. CDC159]|uniref:Uncharacterized protein n=1 Tax=Nocardia pulmonis TaxID=2951408 RepID=A0A9X2E6E0_9NOCA|nr:MULTISPECIES: hypothetical protein [Nocardia]MCM6774962.1 hypothetical protein [Nocardia pulmonis]MCM6789893.1 hypothetical protein [Nocardia sp. CDC159]
MNPDTGTSRELRNDIQALTEKVATLVGSDHPAVITLMRAADELAAAAIADEPPSYGDPPDAG